MKQRGVSTGKDIYNRNTLDDCDLFKCYVVLYTCASTRGVILELVPDASSKYFVYSLRKFTSHRGCPGKILTGNGSVFTSPETQKFATNRNIEWQFTLSNAPRYGCFWERLVSIVKRCLKKIVGKVCLNFYELQIILSEIEMIIISRPLNTLHDDEMYEIMTPNQLLFGRILYQENPNWESHSDIVEPDRPKRIEYVESIIEHFWKRWRFEYITSLRECEKSFKPKNHLFPAKNIVLL